MKPQLDEPPCRPGYEHGFADLGKEDNGEQVSRCGTCMTVRYVAEGGAVRYEVPG
jgi:hypothetical protein